jgi:ribosomal protein L12E/L44/L45/RPP1/RPP2
MRGAVVAAVAAAVVAVAAAGAAGVATRAAMSHRPRWAAEGVVHGTTEENEPEETQRGNLPT